MALVTPPRNSVAIQKRPLMLKDYLMVDDLSSCSSNGFKSFPRRQCCTTIRFLLDIDLKSSATPQLPPSIHNRQNQTQLLRRSRSRASASTTLSALQRASGAFINAVKNLQFHPVKSSSSSSASVQSSSARKGGLVLLLPRSLSRRLWRQSFRTKGLVKEVEEEKDIGRWRSFREFLEEDDKPSDQTTTASTRSTDSKSWGESEFTVNSESSNENDAAEGETTLPEKKKVSGRVGATAGADSIELPFSTTTCSPQNEKVWLNKEEEKEQFSPVSVLDCPFEDEDDESSSSSPFRCRIARMEGTQHKLMQKIRRFENLAQVEPVDLEKRITMSEADDGDELGNRTEEKAGELVKQLIMKTRSSSMGLHTKADKLVVDLFRERSVENSEENVVMEEVLKVVEKWVNEESQELLTSWEVENGRKVYVNDMDNKYCGNWMKLDEQEKEVGLELEVEVWNSLFNEFLLDLIS